jgi:hypothetical protein
VTSVARVRRLAARRRLVGRADWRCFWKQLRGPLPLSTLRATADGTYVSATLLLRGLRPLVREQRPAVRRDPTKARSVAAAVDAGLAVVPVTPTCLRRSVTLLRELERQGLEGTLHVGVRRGPEAVEAHAWVQVGDEVVNDDPQLVAGYTLLAAGDLERVLPGLA